MSKPIAVCISDIHYSLPNLKLADAAMRMAIDKANTLAVPLIVAGDLHDTKANLRGECVNAILQTFLTCKEDCYVLVGNHDKINEKSDENALGFLRHMKGVVRIVDSPLYCKVGWLIPYQHDANAARDAISSVAALRSDSKIIIMHQGLQSSNSGEYFQDKSAINPEDVAGMRVISGHYHTRQTIKLPNGGTWDYIGNPYTTSYGEANDPPKGFQVLYSDGSLEFIPTNLRAHRIITCGWDKRHNFFWGPILKGRPDDLIWAKVTGTKEQLRVVTKSWLKNQGYEAFQGDFKLDLIPLESETAAPVKTKEKGELLDSLIDSLTNTTQDSKDRLKDLWRDLESK